MPTARGVWENVIAALVVMALVAAAAWGISHIDAPITLWVVFVIAVFTALIGFAIGLIWGFGDDLLGYQADLLGEAILALRNVIAGKINVSFEDFIERGVLAPARPLLFAQSVACRPCA